MPPKNQPDSLQKNSMLSIARNFDSICYRVASKKKMYEMIYDESYLNIEGPFQNLPSSILSSMMDYIETERDGRLQRSHCHILIQPHLEALTLGSTGSTFVIEFLISRCQRLRHLDLSYLRGVGPPVLLRLMPNLSQIVTLNLHTTETTDQCLGLIGQHCSEIRELMVSNCPVTEAGITRLCYDAQLDKPQCQKLVKLSVAGSPVTPRAIAFLLQYIPTLRELDYDDIFLAFGVMKEWGLTRDNMDTCEKLQLRILNSTNEDVDPFNVDIAVNLCPFVTNVTLSNAFIENELLYKVMVLEHLAHLRITNSEGLSLDFYEGVLPVLLVKGPQLLTLLLANFTSIDLLAIGENCLRLENFALSNIGWYEDIMYPREHLFTRLKGLEIWTALTVETMTPAILRQLLSYCPDIRNLLIRAADALCDKLLFDVWTVNEMRGLTRLTVDSCPNITSALIQYLFDAPNNLSLLRVWNCFHITKDDDIKFQKRIKDENLNSYVEWFPFTG